MSQPSTLFPLAQGLSLAPHPPQAPSRACRRCNIYGISGTRPNSARMAHLTRHTDAHPLSLGPPGAYHAHTGLSNNALSGSGATVGRSPRRSDNPLCSPPPIYASLCCQCPVDVVGRRMSIVSRVLGFRGPRVKGFLGLNGFKGTKGPKASGFRG